MKVDVQYAEQHFADLVAAASRGEEVEIDVSASVGLVLRTNNAVPRSPAGSRRELLGAWEGKVQLPSDEDWAAMDKEIEEEMLSGLNSFGEGR